jgi:hypothetical protein
MVQQLYKYWCTQRGVLTLVSAHARTQNPPTGIALYWRKEENDYFVALEGIVKAVPFSSTARCSTQQMMCLTSMVQ